MSDHCRLLLLVLGLALVLLSAPARAQDYSAGKTPPQLFATDCSACHKFPHGLAKGKEVRYLTGFLREHYTTKPASASALATYLASVANQKPPAPEKPPETAETKLGEDAKARPGGAVVGATNPAAGDAEELNPMQTLLRAYAASGDGPIAADYGHAVSAAESYAHSGEGAPLAHDGAAAPHAAQPEPAHPAVHPVTAPNETEAARPAPPAPVPAATPASAPVPAASGGAQKKKPAPAAPTARRIEPPVPVDRNTGN